MAIWKDNAGQAAFTLLYFEDSKTNIPAWVMSQAAASTMPASFIEAMSVARKYPQERVAKTLARYGIQQPSGDKEDNTADDGDFFSASDEEDSPSPKTSRPGLARRLGNFFMGPSHKKSRISGKGESDGKIEMMRSKERKGAEPGVLRLSFGKEKATTHKSTEDLEEGLLLLSREERDLLLEVLAETRSRQIGSGYFWWCPCRRRCCGHRRRHKL